MEANGSFACVGPLQFHLLCISWGQLVVSKINSQALVPEVVIALQKVTLVTLLQRVPSPRILLACKLKPDFLCENLNSRPAGKYY